MKYLIMLLLAVSISTAETFKEAPAPDVAHEINWQKPDWALSAEKHMLQAMRQSAFADQIILGYGKEAHGLSKAKAAQAKGHAAAADWHRRMAIKMLAERHIP